MKAMDTIQSSPADGMGGVGKYWNWSTEKVDQFLEQGKKEAEQLKKKIEQIEKETEQGKKETERLLDESPWLQDELMDIRFVEAHRLIGGDTAGD
jgi:hypothetical protein